VPTIEVSRRIAADPAELYALISDVTRMDRWSPEATGADWIDGEPGTLGARFRGRNRHGPFRWSTTCTVTAADPGRAFGFRVTWLGRPISFWEFRLVAHPDGCEVTECAADLRSGPVRLVTSIGTGVARRAARNRSTMEATLQALDRATRSP
jgi:uncharacterized protein YndB with AHSA1/START domain